MDQTTNLLILKKIDLDLNMLNLNNTLIYWYNSIKQKFEIKRNKTLNVSEKL